MSRAYERHGDRLTAQASAAITANTLSTGAATFIDKASGRNADGAQWFDCYVDVTGAPAAAATCELWISGSSDGMDESVYEYALSVAIPVIVPVTVPDQYRLGVLYGTPREFYAKIKAISNAFIATLYLVPAWIADA